VPHYMIRTNMSSKRK